MTSVNLQDLFKAHQEEELAVLPAGEYTLEVIRANVRNDNAILPTYKVVNGPYAGKQVMAGQLTLTDAAKSIFFRNLKGFGLNKEFIETCQGLQDVANSLVGRVVKMQIEIRPWKGEDRNSFPIGGVELVSAGSGLPPQGAPAAAPASQTLPPPPPAPGTGTTQPSF